MEAPHLLPRWIARTQPAMQNVSQPTSEQAPVATPSPSLVAQGRTQFETAVRPSLPRLFRFCLALSGSPDHADDLFQSTLIKAYLNASSFEGRSELVVWLCGIAWHEHLETRRTEARRRGLFEQFVDACTAALGFGPESGEQPTPEALVADGQTHELLLTCLQTLPEEFRAVVVLCDIEELGYDRVAEILGIPKGTVKSRHARGRVRLRAAYEKLVMNAGSSIGKQKST